SRTSPESSRTAALCSLVFSAPPPGTSAWATVSPDRWATRDSRWTALLNPSKLPRAVLPSRAKASGGPSSAAGIRPSRASAQQGLGPAGQGGLQGGRRDGHEHLADTAGLGGPPGEAEAVHQLDVVVVGPLGDGRIAAGAAQDGAAGQRQDRR